MQTDAGLLQAKQREDPGQPLLFSLAVVGLQLGLRDIDLDDEPKDNPENVHQYFVEHSDEQRPPESPEH